MPYTHLDVSITVPRAREPRRFAASPQRAREAQAAYRARHDRLAAWLVPITLAIAILCFAALEIALSQSMFGL